MEKRKSMQENITPPLLRNCHSKDGDVSKFEPTNGNPDEECITCILNHILRLPEGEIRDACKAYYKTGMMKLNCAKTKKSYMISKEFFEKIDYKE